MPWRTAGIGLTSIGTPIGIGVADPLLGQIAIAIELAVALTIIGTALFGSQALSERAFRLLRWIANRPEPPEPAAPGLPHPLHAHDGVAPLASPAPTDRDVIDRPVRRDSKVPMPVDAEGVFLRHYNDYSPRLLVFTPREPGHCPPSAETSSATTSSLAPTGSWRGRMTRCPA